MKYLLVILVIGTVSCIEEIDFTAEEEKGTLVVDCTLSTFSDTNFVHLFRTGNLGDQFLSPELGAQITLHDNLGNQMDATSLENGFYYFLRDHLEIIVGQSYYLNIKTNDGRIYQSETETIQPAPEIQKLAFDFSIEQIVDRETRVLERSFFNLFLHTTLPTIADNTFLKWDVEHVFTVIELMCHPLATPKVCYLSRPIGMNEVLLLDGTLFSGGSEIKEQVAHVEMDYAFGLTASFYVSQKSLTATAHSYWQKVHKVISGGGSIFEAPPAAIPGNIVSISHPKEEVLGLFSAVDEKRELIFITRGDLATGFDHLPLCGQLGFPPPNRPRACCNCLSLENSTLTRPSYWP